MIKRLKQIIKGNINEEIKELQAIAKSRPQFIKTVKKIGLDKKTVLKIDGAKEWIFGAACWDEAFTYMVCKCYPLFNEIGQSYEDLTGSLQHLLFFTRTGFNQLQDVFLKPSYRYPSLLRSSKSYRCPRRNHDDKHKQHQADTQRFKGKKFHCLKSPPGGSLNKLGDCAFFVLNLRNMLIMVMYTHYRSNNQIESQ